MTGDWVGPVVTASAALAGALSSAWIGSRAALRREIDIGRRADLQQAASDVGAALRSLRKVVRGSSFGQTVPEDVSGALLGFQDEWDRYEHLFPERWPSLQREVNHALGTHFGPVGWSNRQLDQASTPLAPTDTIWAERAESYLDHLIRCTAKWGQDPDKHRAAPLKFDPWLAECERRSAQGPAPPLALRLIAAVLGLRRQRAERVGCGAPVAGSG